MAVETSKLVAAPFPLTLNGKEWLISPLTDLDHEEISQWVRSQHVQMAIKAATGLPKDQFEAVVGVALNQSHEMDWTSGSGRLIMATIKGVCRLVWQSVKKRHPQATEKDIQDCLLSGNHDENLTLAMHAFNEVNSVTLKNEPTPAGE